MNTTINKEDLLRDAHYSFCSYSESNWHYLSNAYQYDDVVLNAAKSPNVIGYCLRLGMTYKQAKEIEAKTNEYWEYSKNNMRDYCNP